jgi:hypothetical protein
MRRSLPIIIALGLILGTGVAQGVWSYRWRSPFDYDKMTTTLQGVPKTLGDWEGEDQEVDEDSLQVGRIDAYLSRIYTNRYTGESVGILLVCGQPGPISLHPPTICFSAAGAVQISPVTSHDFVYAPTGEDLKYFTTDFSRGSSPADTIQTRVLWTWKGTGSWLAPSLPRWAFGSEPLLAKLYVTRSERELPPLDPIQGQAVDESTGELLRLLMPELDRVMKILPTCRIGA